MTKTDKEKLALAWFDAGIFLDKSGSPEGRGFRLKLHDSQPDAPLSPFYLNFRLLRSFPELLAQTARLFVEMLEGTICDLVGDVPTAATPLVTLVSQYRSIPMVTPREMKKHGSGATIDGVYRPGQRVALFDDLITKAGSKLESIRVLEAEQLKVAGVFMLVDREQGGMDELRNAGHLAFAAYTMTELLQLFRAGLRINSDLLREILAYLFPDRDLG